LPPRFMLPTALVACRKELRPSQGEGCSVHHWRHCRLGTQRRRVPTRWRASRGPSLDDRLCEVVDRFRERYGVTPPLGRGCVKVPPCRYPPLREVTPDKAGGETVNRSRRCRFSLWEEYSRWRRAGMSRAMVGACIGTACGVLALAGLGAWTGYTH